MVAKQLFLCLQWDSNPATNFNAISQVEHVEEASDELTDMSNLALILFLTPLRIWKSFTSKFFIALLNFLIKTYEMK